MERDEILEIVLKQKESLQEMDKVVKALTKDDTLKQNQDLKQKCESLKQKVADLEEELKKVKTEKNELREKLFGIFYDQKTRNVKKTFEVLNKSKDTFVFEYETQLKAFEARFTEKIKNQLDVVQIKEDQEYIDFVNRIKELDNEVKVFVAKKLEEEARILAEAESKLKTAEDKVLTQSFTEEEVNQKLKTLNLELKFGSKFTNLVGMLLIMLSIMYGAYLTYDIFGGFISDEMKTAGIYLLGFIIIGLSEYFRKRTTKTFYSVILGGGVGVLYLATTIGYFVFDGVLSSTATMVIVAVISVATFLLATKNDVETISIFALIGGYMPLIEFSVTEGYITAMVFYTLALNLLAMFTSMKKDWKITKYVSFSLNFITTVPFMWLIISNEYWGFTPILIYTTVIMLISLGTIVYYPIKYNKEISVFEKVILCLNVFLNYSIIIYIMEIYHPDFSGYGVLILSILYFALGWLVEKKAVTQQDIFNMFYLIAIGFSFYGFEIQYGRETTNTLFIIESTILIIYGIHRNTKVFEYAGKLGMAVVTVILLATTNSVINMDIIIMGESWYMLIIANLGILAYIYYTNWGQRFTIGSKGMMGPYKVYVLLLLYRYLVFLSDKIVFALTPVYNIEYQYAVIILLICILNIAIAQFKFIKDEILEGTIAVATVILTFSLFSLGVSDMLNINIIFGFVLNGVLGVAIYYSVRDYNNDKEKILVTTAFETMILLVNALMIYCDIEFSSYYLSLSCLVVALGFIIIGFKENVSYLRKSMLVMIYVLISKIFLIDFKIDGQVARVVTLFAFGVILVLISFLYQKFAKKMYDIYGIEESEADTSERLNKLFNKIVKADTSENANDTNETETEAEEVLEEVDNTNNADENSNDKE